MGPGTRVKSVVNLGLTTEENTGARFFGTVPAGTLGTVLDLDLGLSESGWRAVRFDGFETVDVYGEPEPAIAPVGPGHVEVATTQAAETRPPVSPPANSQPPPDSLSE